MYWQTRRFRIDLREPRVMAIVNLTPDSFSDGGVALDPSAALARCERLVSEGADILDLGAESTRPGAVRPSAAVECERLRPVLRELVAWDVPLSVDTSAPEVIDMALTLGVDIINDVRALQEPGALTRVAADSACGVCLMHMHGVPATMQLQTMEGDPLPQVRAFLRSRTEALMRSGIASERICWDPGIGFGKTLEQNLALTARLEELAADGHPLLIGWSRKGSLGKITGLALGERLVPSVAAALCAASHGARVLRVHDVGSTVAAMKVWISIARLTATHNTRDV